MTDRDPLDDLRAAWRDLGVPAPDDDVATDALVDDLRGAWAGLDEPAADHDPATDALVDDLRAAWGRLEAPAADPRLLQRALRQRERFQRVRERLVLVAAGLLLCALVFTAGADFGPQSGSTEQVATHDTDDSSEPAGGSPAQPGDAQDAQDAQDANPQARRLDDSVRARVLDDGSMELRTGRVRLLLSDSNATTVLESNDDTTDPDALPADERR